MCSWRSRTRTWCGSTMISTSFSDSVRRDDTTTARSDTTRCRGARRPRWMMAEPQREVPVQRANWGSGAPQLRKVEERLIDGYYGRQGLDTKGPAFDQIDATNELRGYRSEEHTSELQS